MPSVHRRGSCIMLALPASMNWTDLLTDSLPSESLLLGISQFSRILHVKSTPQRRELGNCLIVAPTRAGKGLLAVSQLLTWKHSAVVFDIKGELFDQTAG